MNNKTNKGMLKRTLGLYRNIRIPWPLYLLQVVLGIVVTKVALLYIPYESDLKIGNVDRPNLLLGYVGLLLLSVVMTIVARIPEFYASSMVTKNLQNKLINRSLRLPMKSFEKNASEIVSWITQDCEYADGLITSVIGFITGIAATYMSVKSMQAIDTTMLYLVPFILVYIIFSTWLEGKLMYLRERRGRRAYAELTAYLSEHLSYFIQIKQLHSQGEEVTRGKLAIEHYYRAEIYQSVLTLINGLVNGSLTNIISILIFLLGVPRVNDGTITLAELAAFQSYILIAYNSLSSIPGMYTSLMYYNGLLFYISGLMAEKEEKYDRERTMDMEDRDLIFENVSFGYGDEPIIKNASFTIPQGKVTVIAGPNGSGKTTLFKLIERFYTPDDGKMYFGEFDAETIDLNQWRRSMAYVLQEPQLFDGTIRENINYGMSRDVTEEETQSAAKLACADEFISELPGGYDFVIGENGCKLSAGQRQRIAIARAVMLDPAYLLLDEATCNMDVYSEKQVSAALSKLMQGRTTIVISHDMKTLETADHVIVINGGTIEAEGTPRQAEQTSDTLKKLIAANA
ncbi:MAG: ABC transporter ATP-binding protein/permease [Ruminococcus sp.]|nr:ABC transporter ATP-binding protein/permease [Ruminococcus sp.]